MTISMYSASVPSFERALVALDAILDKAAAWAEERKIDPAVLTAARLAPDMYPLNRQIHLLSDTAKGAAARLAGLPVPGFPDTETTFPELKSRIARTLDFIRSVRPDQIDGSEERQIIVKTSRQDLEFKGQDYLVGFALPNFYFHVTVAYAILRHNGVPLGKRDYLAGA
jgi:hypothetical protein